MTEDNKNKVIPYKKERQIELFEAEEIVRPELNLAKHADRIFISPHSKNVKEIRQYKWETDIAGASMEAGIVIHPLKDRKTPTTTTYKIFLALVQVWEKQGKPVNGVITFSGRQLASILGLKWSGRVAERISENLEILWGTGITWSWAWSDGEDKHRIKRGMRILDGKESYYIDKNITLPSEIGQKLHKAQFSEQILANMLNGVTKPINYKALRSIRSDAGTIVYTKLDTILKNADRTYERRAKALLMDDIQLAGKRYEEKKHRKVKLKEIVSAINGLPLAYGKLKVSMEETADKQDYKLVAEVERIPLKSRKPPTLANPKEMIPVIVKDIIDGLRMLGGSNDKPNEGVLKQVASWYPDIMLYEVLAIVKADYRGNVKKSPIRLYLAQLHIEVHKRGMKWFSKACKGKDCRYHGTLPLLEGEKER